MEKKAGIFHKIFYLRLLLHLISPFSRIANKINWRFGRKFCCESINIESVISLLQNADVILTHRDFEFTNIFLGGYYTHAGVVIEGHLVIEATSKGVHVSNIDDFLKKTDDFLILRNIKISDPGTIINRLLPEIGKKYNFTFIPNPHSITCAELIFYIFDVKAKAFPLKINQKKEIFSFFRQYSIHPESLLNHPDFEVIEIFSNHENQNAREATIEMAVS